MRGWVCGIWKCIIMYKFWFITQAASFCVKKVTNLKWQKKIAILLQTLQLFYLLQTLSYWFKIMVDFLYSKVNMKFEVQFQINFVAFFMWHQLGIVPNLKELFLLHIVESVQQLSISIIRYYCNTLCNNYSFQLCFSVAKAALESQMSAFCPSVPQNQNPSATLCFRYSRLLSISACF